MFEVKIPKILFIKGVFKKDCSTDDIFDQKILENIISEDTTYSNDVEINNFVSYDKLPQIFENIKTWPKKTNLHCWHCTLQFDKTPVFIPKVIEPVTYKNKADRENISEQRFSVSVHGVFCSFGCAYNFIYNKDYNISDKIEFMNKLKLLYKFFYQKNMKDYVSYPEPFQMKQYGGNLSIEEYKEEVNKCIEMESVEAQHVY